MSIRDSTVSLGELDEIRNYETLNKTDKDKANQSKLLSDVGKEKLMFPEVQEIFAQLRVGLARDEAYAFCLDIVKSRLLVESIKKSMTIEEIKELHAVDNANRIGSGGHESTGEHESNHI